MSAQILDGKVLASKLKEQLAQDISSLKASHHKVPHIVSIVIGNDPGSISYVTSQQRTAESLGIQYELMKVPLDISQEKLFGDVLQPLNEDRSVHGILLNKPVPPQINFDLSTACIDPRKSIEGMNAFHLGELLQGKAKFVPCTPAGALALLKTANVPLAGKHAVIIGRSEIVGKPMMLLLLKEDMTVTVCHSKTTDLKAQLLQADVVVAAIGRKRFVQGDWIKPGAIVIDVGINDDNGKIAGDVDFESCKTKASYITPVPGGVGPVTSVMLMKNALEGFKQSL